LTENNRDSLIEYLSDGLLVLDSKNHLLDVNRSAIELIPDADSSGIGQDISVFLTHWPELLSCLKDKNCGDFTLAFSQGETRRLLDVHIDAMINTEDRQNGRIVTIRDITRYWEFEEQLHLHSAAIHSAANAIVITDRDGMIKWINPSFTKLTGYTFPDVVGKSLRILKSGVHDADFYKDMWTTIGNGEIWHGELINRRKDGSLYTEEMTIAPITVDSSEITHYVAVKQDISERKSIEQSRIDLNRTIVHDLRNPLTSLITALRLAEVIPIEKALPIDDEQRKVLSLAMQNAQRMMGLIDGLLETSRIESGVQLNIESLSVGPLVDHVIQLQVPIASERKVYVDNLLPDSLPQVRADGKMIERVLQNLLDNAIKFTPQNSRVQLNGRVLPGGEHIQILVSDQGPGIHPELRNRLFEKFASGSERGSGTGLGLAFCRLAVEAHNGRIWIDTEQKQGTTISFTLPVSPTLDN
jgi:PAS domain S-box-containing protein